MSRRKKSDDVADFTQGTVLDYIDNLAVSVFRWSGYSLDECPSSELLERMLMERGRVGAFPTNIGLQVLPATIPNINQWGFEAEGSATPISVGNGPVAITLDTESKIAPIILYDQPNHRTIVNNLDWYVTALGKLKRAINDATVWLKTPMAFMATDYDAVDSIKEMLRQISRGDDAVAILDKSFNLENIKIIPTNVTPAVLQALHDSYDRVQSKLFEELGVPDYNSTKQAQQTSTEVLLPMLAVALKTMQRFYIRKDWCDRVNAAYGKTYTVECLTLGLIEQSIFSSTGVQVNLMDINKNGIPDKLEGGAGNE